VNALVPFEIIRAEALLGEGIVWDSRRDVLWWTDIQRNALHRFDWTTGSVQILETPDRVGSFGLIADSERLITAFASGIALYDAHQKSVAWLARPDGIVPGLRFNDGRVDRQGRFWVGTMVESPAGAATACLYSIDGNAGLRCHVRGVRISNGLCVSPDGTRLYFADSPTRTISVYELVEPEGTLRAPRIFARTPDGAFPDGAASCATRRTVASTGRSACRHVNRAASALLAPSSTSCASRRRASISMPQRCTPSRTRATYSCIAPVPKAWPNPSTRHEFSCAGPEPDVRRRSVTIRTSR